MFICQIGVVSFTYIESVAKAFGIETEKLKKQSHFKLELKKSSLQDHAYVPF